MTHYVVDSEAVLTGATAVRSTADRVTSEIAALDGHLADLQGRWTGSASVAFAGVIEQWRTAQRQLTESLASIDRALITAGQHYADVERANAALFQV